MPVSFFFQAEDGIRYLYVTGVQTCALPIFGSELPRLHPVVLPIAPGDTLIFATDGIREGFAEGLPPEAAPQQLADQILARHGKGTDDALVLVARYLGGAGTRG